MSFTITTSQSNKPNLAPPATAYSIVESYYGKSFVKLLHISRNGKYHVAKEVEVDTRLTLNSTIDYTVGDNRDIVATDSQKNIVYVTARQHGIKSPEEFAILLCEIFLRKYPQVIAAHVTVTEYPWERIMINGRPHNHAFVMVPTAERWSTVQLKRSEVPIGLDKVLGVPLVLFTSGISSGFTTRRYDSYLPGKSPFVESGLRNLRVLKTTQSSFVNFVKDEFRTLPDAQDRVFSTLVTASWRYSTVEGLDFDGAWNSVKDSIIENFAGDPEDGVYSPSVQHTLYEVEIDALNKIPQMESIVMDLPNKHYVEIDLSNFPKEIVGEGPNHDVLLPLDKPSGLIHARLERRTKSKI